MKLQRAEEPHLFRSGDRVVVTRRRMGDVHGVITRSAPPRDNRSRYWVLLDDGRAVFVTTNKNLVRENPLESLSLCGEAKHGKPRPSLRSR